MPRVLVLNNYPLDAVWDEVRRGEKPDHHLYGINHFQELGFEVDILPQVESRRLSKWGRLIKRALWPIPLGDLDHQWRAWRQLNGYDLLYAPCGDQTQILAYLRALGLLKTPLVAIIHHPPNFGRLRFVREPWTRLMIRGHDALPTLGAAVAEDLNGRLGGNRADFKKKAFPVNWGPDRTFYPIAKGSGEGFIAAGRTGRDFITFGLAASQLSHPAEIICLDYDLRPEFADFATNIQVSVAESDRVMPYPAFLRRMAECRAIAIPLYVGSGLTGLTSLMDALGIGRPVIMTRNRYIDLDIEALGIGRWVQPGDVTGWRDAMSWFASHPEESTAMGERSRSLVENHNLDSLNFAKQLTRCFDQILRTQNG